MASTDRLDSIFNPRSVAIINISTSKPGSVAENYLEALIKCNFSGPIYPINLNGGEFGTSRYMPILSMYRGTLITISAASKYHQCHN
jgi:hypothetical protein